MPCGTAHAMMSCTHHVARACRQASTLCICGMVGITYGHTIRTSLTIFIKNNHLTFYHPKYGFCKLEHAEKDANWNENFMICAEESIAPLYEQ